MTEAAADAVVLEREMSHPIQKVWRALTEGPLLADWLWPNDFEPAVGRRFTFRAPPAPQWNGVVEGEVLALEPPARLAYSWNSGGFETVVTWTLTPTAAGVRLRMEQAGFGPDQEANRRGAEYGWRRFLEGLERVVAGLD